MAKRKASLVKPELTAAQIADFPPTTASSADVFNWIKSQCCNKAQEPSCSLKHVDQLTGHYLHTKRANGLTVIFKRMGFRKSGRGVFSTKLARSIIGRVLSAREVIKKSRIGDGDAEANDEESNEEEASDEEASDEGSNDEAKSTKTVNTSPLDGRNSAIYKPICRPIETLQGYSPFQNRIAPASNDIANPSTQRSPSLTSSRVVSVPRKRKRKNEEPAINKDHDEQDELGGYRSTTDNHACSKRPKTTSQVAASHNGSTQEGGFDENEYEEDDDKNDDEDDDQEDN
ncbi:hypothetical protein VTL71DRAFT_865 [Oculimacula yallundae]|uniref:Uncharacterized protein n=1 Tax=Oculimacula yallundae TaxID=86028 RepID=A0ABR4D1B0_9HELO